MNQFRTNLAISKFNLMQLRARGLPTKRVSELHQELSHMKDLIILLREDVQDATKQRDYWYQAFKNMTEVKE